MRILVVEDHPDILANIMDYLALHGHQVDCAQDGVTGLHLAVTQAFDIIVLDVMLPGMDGYQFCKRLRDDARMDTPIIMLTARDALPDRLQGLRAGADDYLLKPFALAELAARIETIVRRSQRRSHTLLSVADLEYDLDTLHVSRAGVALRLNPICLKLLQVLMQRSPAIVRRQALEELIWGDHVPESDSLRTHMHQLRSLVDKPFDTPLIHTLRGIGYRLSEHHV